MITFERVYTLTDFDFDTLVTDSFPDININFFNQVPFELTDTEKKQYYLDQLTHALNGTSPLQKEGESLFGFKIVVDGIDKVVNFGFIEADGVTYRGHWYLTSTVNGSRSFIYSSEADVARHNFYTSFGITSYKAPTFKTSLMYQALQRNNSSNVISIIEEVNNSQLSSIEGVAVKVQV